MSYSWARQAGLNVTSQVRWPRLERRPGSSVLLSHDWWTSCRCAGWLTAGHTITEPIRNERREDMKHKEETDSLKVMMMMMMMSYLSADYKVCIMKEGCRTIWVMLVKFVLHSVSRSFMYIRVVELLLFRIFTYVLFSCCDGTESAGSWCKCPVKSFLCWLHVPVNVLWTPARIWHHVLLGVKQNQSCFSEERLCFQLWLLFSWSYRNNIQQLTDPDPLVLISLQSNCFWNKISFCFHVFLLQLFAATDCSWLKGFTGLKLEFVSRRSDGNGLYLFYCTLWTW